MTIDTILEKQRKYFASGATLPVKFRIEMLKKLYSTVKKYEKEIAEALKADLGKEGFDVFSHTKSIVDKKTWMDLPMRYQPYNRGIYAKLLHIFLK